MNGRVIRSDLALADLDEQSEYIRQDNPRAALRFLTAAEATFRQLASMPGLGERFETNGQSTNLQEPAAMTESGAAARRTPRLKGRKGLRILVAGLGALLMVHLMVRLTPGLPGADEGAGLPLDRCFTERAVVKFLDGKTVVASVSMPGAESGVETITLRKEKISSVVMRGDDNGSILVRFNLDQEGKQYLIECSFVFTTSDDPSLHYHGFEQFVGRVVSTH